MQDTKCRKCGGLGDFVVPKDTKLGTCAVQCQNCKYETSAKKTTNEAGLEWHRVNSIRRFMPDDFVRSGSTDEDKDGTAVGIVTAVYTHRNEESCHVRWPDQSYGDYSLVDSRNLVIANELDFCHQRIEFLDKELAKKENS